MLLQAGALPVVDAQCAASLAETAACSAAIGAQAMGVRGGRWCAQTGAESARAAWRWRLVDLRAKVPLSPVVIQVFPLKRQQNLETGG